MNDMGRRGCQLPPNFRGYIILRDALLTDRAWDIVEQWTEGSYDQEKVIAALKRLERPRPGGGGTTMGFSGFEEPPTSCSKETKMNKM